MTDMKWFGTVSTQRKTSIDRSHCEGLTCSEVAELVYGMAVAEILKLGHRCHYILCAMAVRRNREYSKLVYIYFLTFSLE